MHIPDGFLDAKTSAAAAGLSAIGLALALRQAKRSMPRRAVPLMGLAAAFTLAAQMLNFPVAAGTSGHFLGSALIAVLLGPAAAVITLSCVLIVQCLLFSDGGLLALGANLFNMALVASVSAYGLYSAVRRLWPGIAGRLAGVAIAAWASTILASVCCAGELAWSRTADWSAVLPAMAGVHALIGLGEAAITTLVVAALDRSGFAVPQSRPGRGATLALGLLVALGLIVFVAPRASHLPDGLETVAAHLGFAAKARP